MHRTFNLCLSAVNYHSTFFPIVSTESSIFASSHEFFRISYIVLDVEIFCMCLELCGVLSKKQLKVELVCYHKCLGKFSVGLEKYILTKFLLTDLMVQNYSY